MNNYGVSPTRRTYEFYVARHKVPVQELVREVYAGRSIAHLKSFKRYRRYVRWSKSPVKELFALKDRVRVMTEFLATIRDGDAVVFPYGINHREPRWEPFPKSRSIGATTLELTERYKSLYDSTPREGRTNRPDAPIYIINPDMEEDFKTLLDNKRAHFTVRPHAFEDPSDPSVLMDSLERGTQ